MAYTTTEILESATENNGSRTVLKSVLAPYATVFPHFHTLFKETVEVVEGEIDIWNGFGKLHLEKGQSASIEKNTLHRYVAGKMQTTVMITFEPGNLDFENAMRILKGLQHDGNTLHLSTPQASNLALLTIIFQLTDSTPVEDTKISMDNLLQSPEGYKVEEFKQECLKKYCQ